MSLEAELTVVPVRGKSTEMEVRFRYGAPYKVARAVAKVAVTPEAKRLKGSAEWRGSIGANRKKTLTLRYRLPRQGEYLVTATFESLHAKTGEVVTGTRRTQRVRSGQAGIEPIAEESGK